MRYVGMVCMVLAAVGGGFYAGWFLHMQLEILTTFRQMFSYLKGRILYGNDPLPDALAEIGNRFYKEKRDGTYVPGGFFLQVARRMELEKNRNFSEIWKEEVRRIPADVLPYKTDRQNLADLGDHLGYADRSMQERTLNFYLEQTEESIAAKKRELEEKTKLYRSLGLAAGLFLVVVLI